MYPSLVLRVITLVAVVISGVLYFQIRDQKSQISENLIQSRIALQQKMEEAASLKSRVLNAEEESRLQKELAEEEKTLTRGYREQFDRLSEEADVAITAKTKAEEEISRLNALNRDLQRQVNVLQAAVPPQNWREQLNQLQSRLLELEAENTSLKRSLVATGRTVPAASQATEVPHQARVINTQPVGKVIRIGPDGSFAIISFGRQLGAAEGQTLTIKREQQVVALVSITQITNDFSIAQILSSTNTGSSLSVPDIQIGDTAHLE